MLRRLQYRDKDYNGSNTAIEIVVASAGPDLAPCTRACIAVLAYVVSRPHRGSQNLHRRRLAHREEEGVNPKSYVSGLGSGKIHQLRGFSMRYNYTGGQFFAKYFASKGSCSSFQVSTGCWFSCDTFSLPSFA
jgi:hypothetical protein